MRGRRRPGCGRTLSSWLSGVAAFVVSAALVPVNPLPVAAEISSNYQGFDGCQGNYQPNTTQMQAYWTGTPMWQYYMYLPGDYGWPTCPNGISSTWVQAVHNGGGPYPMRYGLVAIMVGPQCCTTDSGRTYPYWISLNTSTAYSQGKTEADDAVLQLGQYGISDSTFPIVYDLEGYQGTMDSSNCYVHNVEAQCDAAVRSFVSGWVWEMHNVQSQYWVGVYGSSCDSNPSNWVGSTPFPDFVWIAWANRGGPSVWNYVCLSDGYWIQDQRHGQYRGTHTGPKYNGVQLSIDSDCAQSYIWSGPSPIYNDTDNSGESPGVSEDDPFACPGAIQ